MRHPTNTRVTFPYGATSAPYSPSMPHAGTDYGYSYLHPYVFAPEDITVTFVGEQGPCGKSINATGKGGRTYRFCHLNNAAVSTGTTYREGSKIARIGDTGFAFGKHLHFVAWVYGTRVDPYQLVEKVMKEEADVATVTLESTIEKLNKVRAERDTLKKQVANLERALSEQESILAEVRLAAKNAENGLKQELESANSKIVQLTETVSSIREDLDNAQVAEEQAVKNWFNKLVERIISWVK